RAGKAHGSKKTSIPTMKEFIRKRIDEAKEALLACPEGTLTDTHLNRIIPQLRDHWQVSGRTVQPGLSYARFEINAEKEMERQAAEQVRLQHAREMAEKRMKDLEIIDEELMSIITGKARVKKIIYNKGVPEVAEIEPDFNVKIKAAQTY